MKKLGKINIVACLIIVFCIATIIKIKVPEQEIRSVTSEGIVATVEEIEADKRQAIISVSVRKEDGTEMDEHTRVSMINVFSNQGMSGYHTSVALSDDHTALNYTFRINPEIGSDMALKNVHIWLNGLMNVYEQSIRLDESIYDLYKKYPLEKGYEESKTKGYIPIKEMEKFSILGAGFTKKSSISGELFETDEPILYIRTKFLGERQTTDNEARISYLYNEQTGEEVSGSYACSLYETDYENKDKEGNPQNLEIMEEYYELTNTEELKYIKPVISYSKKEQIDYNKRTLFVKIKENVEGILQKTDLEINVENLLLNVSEFYMSSLGVAIKGEVLNEEIITKSVSIPAKLQMKDGSYVTLETLSYPNERKFIIDYRSEEKIDIADVVAVDIGGSRVEVKK